MAGRTRRNLLILNGALLGALALVTLAPSAGAERGQPARARGDYSMVAGRVVGGNAAGIYILDTVNQEMIAVRWNQANKAIEGVGFRDLTRDAQQNPGR